MRRARWSFFLPARDHSFIKIFTSLSYSWLTPYGRILVTSLFISVGIASPGLHISAYLLTSIILAVLITAFIFSMFNIPRVELTRKFHSIPSAGEHCVYQVIVKNTTKHPILAVSITEGYLPYGLYYSFDHPSFNNFIPYLEPGRSTTVTLVIYCAKRGIYTLPQLKAGSSYPSNIIRWPKSRGNKETFTVYPFFVSQTQFDVPLKSLFQPGGMTFSSTKGESNEFLSTREYRHGDRLKDIHWPSYARSGKLIVKEYIDEYYVKTAIAVDTQLSPKDNPENLEQRISIAAGIADALANQGYLIDFFAAGETVYEFQKGNPETYREELLKILAATSGQKSIDFKALEAHLMKQKNTLSSLVVILHDWDQDRENLCKTLKSTGITLRIIIVQDDKLTDNPNQKVTIVTDNDKRAIVQ